MKRKKDNGIPSTRAAVVFLYRVAYETYRQLCRKESPTEKEVAVIAHYKEQLKAAQVCIRGDLGLRRVEFADLDAAAEGLERGGAPGLGLGTLQRAEVPAAGGPRPGGREFLERARRYLAGEPGAGDMDPSVARLAVAIAERAEGPGAAAGAQGEAPAPLILQADDTGPGAARIASAMAKYSAAPQDPGSSPEERRALLHIVSRPPGPLVGGQDQDRAVPTAPPKPKARPPRPRIRPPGPTRRKREINRLKNKRLGAVMHLLQSITPHVNHF
jgi:hypothetical protein